ncbi:MAG: alkaline phosphatase family protein [Pararhodobacter sp.]|nr:alkaline phosphatase family protein [Pararhodobacter sp.]
MAAVKNILFIMADQLRWDYLSCYGHPHLKTPNLDGLAARGVRFDRAFVQSPVCGPSRASFYTGRTVFSHGSTWNRVPLPIGEYTIGDYLRPAGMRCAVVGKTHMTPDPDLSGRFGLTPKSEIGILLGEPGFEPYERDDGIHPDKMVQAKPELTYNAWLRSKGYGGDNPWHEHANSAEGPDGEILSGWSLRNSNLPARVAEEHSETAYMTDRALDFIDETGDRPWLLHLSYIKPHWPYMAPAPYHGMFGPGHFLPVNRSAEEREKGHPVYRAFMEMGVSQTFSEPGVRETVLPAYMGLIRQIDDHLGRLFAALEERSLMENTMIVFTSDHGDYLGDHWMGEKELFHDCSMRVPLIIYDPRAEADATRGHVCQDFVEAIDLLPTFLDVLKMEVPSHRLEGHSLKPLLDGLRPDTWRDHAFSEIDYGFYKATETLDVPLEQARGYALRTERWKYVYFKGMRPQLFDLNADPDELNDLGNAPDLEPVRQDLQHRLLERLTNRRNRIALPDSAVGPMRPHNSKSGVVIGRW